MQFKLTLLRQSARKAIKTVVKAIFNTTTLGPDDEDDDVEEEWTKTNRENKKIIICNLFPHYEYPILTTIWSLA